MSISVVLFWSCLHEKPNRVKSDLGHDIPCNVVSHITSHRTIFSKKKFHYQKFGYLLSVLILSIVVVGTVISIHKIQWVLLWRDQFSPKIFTKNIPWLTRRNVGRLLWMKILIYIWLYSLQCCMDYHVFLQDRPWISPWIKSIELDITFHTIVSQLSSHCDVISTWLWHHQQSVDRASEPQGRCMKIIVSIVVYGFVMSCVAYYITQTGIGPHLFYWPHMHDNTIKLVLLYAISFPWSQTGCCSTNNSARQPHWHCGIFLSLLISQKTSKWLYNQDMTIMYNWCSLKVIYMLSQYISTTTSTIPDQNMKVCLTPT